MKEPTDKEIVAAAKAMREFAGSPTPWKDLETWQKWHWLERAYAALRAAQDARVR